MNVKDKLSTINEYFSPKIIGEVNDTFIKVAKIKGDELPWHHHENEDEFFYIIQGSLLFEVENQPSFTMSTGDFFVMKKGIKHRVSSEEECQIMLVEKNTTAHTGDVVSKLTRSLEEQKNNPSN